jgi:hypothetical protein
MTEKLRRYPGARPFSTDQKGIFFGRDQDIKGLAELISIEQSVVLYSKSGLGKSSLINAGVIPKLKEEGSLIPFSFRFGACSSGAANSPLSTTIDRLASLHKSNLLDKILPGDNSLWYHLKSMQVAGEQKKGYLLIFDQFEELFTYPKEQVTEFARQMAELLYTTIPVRFREVMEEKMRGEKKDPFLSDAEMKSLHQPFEIKVMMAIRSDRMSLLNQVTAYLPNILKTCYELKALNNDQAEDAILTPAYLKNDRFITPVFDYTDEAIEKILDFLSKGNTQEIASFQLQILCESVERKVMEQGITLVKTEDLGDIESLYKNYYDDQLATISSREEQHAARLLIEEGLIFEEEERRLTLYEGQIYKTFNISPELLRKLVDCHLLRSEPSTQGEGFNYEISHDSLAAPILKSKKKEGQKKRNSNAGKENCRNWK